MVSRRARGRNTVGTRLEAIDSKLKAVELDTSNVSTETSLVENSVTQTEIAPAAVGTRELGVVSEIVSDGVLNLKTDEVYVNGSPLIVSATDTVKGVVELATVAESSAMSDTSRAVTPAGLAFLGAFARNSNRQINGAFQVNQRGYSSGQHLQPGQYGHDRWKAPYANMFGNGSFETNINGWSVEANSSVTRVTTDSVFGSASARWQINTTGTSNTAFFIPFLNFVVGRKYTVSAHIKAASGTRTVLISASFPAGNTLVASNVWQRISLTFTASTTSANIGLWATSSGASGDAVLVDGIMLTEGELLWPYVDQSPQPVTNLTPNPSFEGTAALTGWVGDNCTIATSTAWAASGTTSMSVAATGTTDCYARNDLGSASMNGFIPGLTYTVSATARLSAALTGATVGGGRERAIVFFANASQIATSTQLANVAGVQRLSVTFTVPSGATNAFIRFYNGHAGGTIFWDAVQLEVGTLHNYVENSYTFTQSPQGQLITLFDGAYIQTIHEQSNISSGLYTASHSGTAAHRIYNAGTTPPAFSTGPIFTTLNGLAPVVHEFDGTGGGKTVGEVQLEKGSVVSPFERLMIDEVLLHCYRYEFRSVADIAQQRISSTGFQITTGQAEFFFNVPATLRATPIISVVNCFWTDGFSANSAITSITPGPTGLRVGRDVVTVAGYAVFSTLGAAGRPGVVSAQGAGAFIDVDSELR